MDIEKLAGIVDDAALNVREITMLTADEPELNMENAYDVQKASVERRLLRGERLVGMKMGLTSRAKMEQMGVHEPIYGRLTDAMVLADGGTLPFDQLCHPRVEPEIAFIMAKDLHGPVNETVALQAVAGVCAALEVIDSRYRDFKFTLPDVVADNTSASFFVLGSTLRPVEQVNLGNLGIVMEINGAPVQIGCSSAIYEHPARSLATLVNMLARRGEGLTAGQIVLAGGATAAVALGSGDHARVIVDELGTAELYVG